MKILCPFHNDHTPSMEVYSNGAYCFVCSKFADHSEIDHMPTEGPLEAPEPEDIAPTLDYIDTLPKKAIRGLILPSDEKAYYLVWPGRDYYKARNYEGEVRYRNPKGITQPLFWANETLSKTLIIIEGEINALSISRSCPEISVCSPGASSQFTAKAVKNYLTKFKEYETIVVIVDEDGPGIKAGIKLTGALNAEGLKAVCEAMQPDANDILVKHGEKRLREYIGKVLGKYMEKSLTG